MYEEKEKEVAKPVSTSFLLTIFKFVVLFLIGGLKAHVCSFIQHNKILNHFALFSVPPLFSFPFSRPFLYLFSNLQLHILTLKILQANLANAFVVRRKAISLKIYCTFCIFYYYFLIIQSI